MLVLIGALLVRTYLLATARKLRGQTHDGLEPLAHGIDCLALFVADVEAQDRDRPTRDMRGDPNGLKGLPRLHRADADRNRNDRELAVTVTAAGAVGAVFACSSLASCIV